MMIERPETPEEKAQRLGIVEAFAQIVKAQRTDSIKARKESGIETIWTEDEEHYAGQDEATRGEWEKGRTPDDSLKRNINNAPTRSTVFLNMTAPYVDAAAARISDMLLPTDDRNFAIREGKVPDLVMQATTPQPSQPPQKQGVLATLMSKVMGPQVGGQPEPAAQAAAVIAKAKAGAERAQTVIDDWLTECRYHAEVRTVIENSARVGVGILKGPHPEKMRERAAIRNADGSWTAEIKQKIKPKSVAVNHWNFYPARSCGEDIQKGDSVFESDDITARGLNELKDVPGYINEMIDLCLDEGPIKAQDGTRTKKANESTKDEDLFQIWYFHGQVSKKDMEAAGCKCGDKAMYPAIVTMVNERIVKVSLSPLDSGEFPYDVMVWKKRIGSWAGEGVARQMRTQQRGVNAATRNLMDNAGLGAGPQIIVDRSKVVPANGKWALTPRKIWWTKTDTEADVTKAFQIAEIPMLQTELLTIVQFWMKQAEDATGLPMLIQGQLGDKPTDKVGIAQIQNNNGSTVLRRIARTFDDRVTERHIGRYYEYLLLHGPNDAKGDFKVEARGSSALVERDIKNQALMQFVGLSPNPVYGLDPAKVAAEVLRGMRIDPTAVQYDAEQKAKMANTPPPEDPRVTAAKIQAKVKEDDIVARAQLQKHQIDTSDANADLDRALAERMAQIDAQLQAQDLSQQARKNLEDNKVALAKVSLQLRTQTELALGDHVIDMHKHRNPTPPQVAPAGVEPVGRAKEGEAFEA